MSARPGTRPRRMRPSEPGVDLQICFPSGAGMSVGIRLASVIARAGSRDSALAATARFLAKETEGSAAAWRRSGDAMIFVAAEGLSTEVRRALVASTSPWAGSAGASLRKLSKTFASIVGSSSPTSVDLEVGFLLLSQDCPEVQASRAELAAAITQLPELDAVIVLGGAEIASGSQPFELDAIRRLTTREREILELIASGLGTQQIADRLVISAKTVKTHVQNILAKLSVKSRLEAVALLRSHGVSPRG